MQFYLDNGQLAQTKLYSSNFIAISVNKSDWHFEPNRLFRKCTHSFVFFLFCIRLVELVELGEFN